MRLKGYIQHKKGEPRRWWMELHKVFDNPSVFTSFSVGVDFDTAQRCRWCRWCCMFSWHRDAHRRKVGMFPFLWSLIRPTQPCNLTDFLSWGFFLDWCTLKGLENWHFLASPPPKNNPSDSCSRFSKQHNLNLLFDSFHFFSFFSFVTPIVQLRQFTN